MLDINPVVTTALTQLTQGGLEPGRDGGLQNARLRYFDPDRRRAGLPEDVAALDLRDDGLEDGGDPGERCGLGARSTVLQGGAFAEHQILSVEWNGKTVPVNAPNFTVNLPAGAGGTLTLTMKRYVNYADGTVSVVSIRPRLDHRRTVLSLRCDGRRPQGVFEAS